MSLLSGLTTDSNIENEKDSVGGGSFGVLESDLYDFTIELAYLTKSQGGALALNLVLSTATGHEYKEQLWITSGKAKGCKNYYERDGERHYLPGFNHANAICLLTLGKEISQLDTEEKTIKLYDFDQGKEMPTQVDMVVDLLGQQISAGVQKQLVNKRVKGDNGEYVDSNETREVNEIDKIFRTRDHLTTAEIRAQISEPEFKETWLKKWKGQVRDRTSKKGADGAAPTAGAPTKPAASDTNSLFS